MERDEEGDGEGDKGDVGESLAVLCAVRVHLCVLT